MSIKIYLLKRDKFSDSRGRQSRSPTPNIFPERHLADLADAGLVDGFHEAHLEEHYLFTDLPFVGIFPYMVGEVFRGYATVWFGNNQCQGPLAPFFILNADNGDLGNQGVMGDDVFQLQ